MIVPTITISADGYQTGQRIPGVAYVLRGIPDLMFGEQLGRDDAARAACRKEYQARAVEFNPPTTGLGSRRYGRCCAIGDVVDVVLVITNPPPMPEPTSRVGDVGGPEPDKRPVCAESCDEDWVWTRGGRGRHV